MLRTGPTDNHRVGWLANPVPLAQGVHLRATSNGDHCRKQMYAGRKNTPAMQHCARGYASARAARQHLGPPGRTEGLRIVSVTLAVDCAPDRTATDRVVPGIPGTGCEAVGVRRNGSRPSFVRHTQFSGILGLPGFWYSKKLMDSHTAANATPAKSATTRPAYDSHKTAFATLAVGALGVVFGDIGTSPLYTLKECMTAAGGAKAGIEDLFGILSLMFWSLVMVVTIKYLTFVMRADNHGEGGIFAGHSSGAFSRNGRAQRQGSGDGLARGHWRCAFVWRRRDHTGDFSSQCG